MNARRIVAAVLALPLVELVVAILVGRTIGVGPTVLLILLGCLLGAIVLRREGNGALADLRAAQQRWSAAGGPSAGSPPAPSRRPADRLLVVLAGVLLLLPGLVSDVAGLLLLLPPVRRAVSGRAAVAARRRGWTVLAPGTGRVISADEVTITDVRVYDEGPGPALGPGPSN